MIGDLCLPLDDVDASLHRERVAALLGRGYDVIASVHTATGRLTDSDRCSIAPLSAASLSTSGADAKRTLALRSGAAVTAAAATAAAARSAGAPPAASCHLRQLTRLHFVAADAVQAAQLAAAEDVVRSYDIVSIAPKNERVMHQACSSLDVDIVVLELTQRAAFKLRPIAIKAALRRGVYFEICYAPGLRESTARRNLFCNAAALVRATRGRNILLSSSARSAFEVRSPLELMHIAALFGLSRQQAQDAIRLAPKAVLARAAARLAGRGAAALAAPSAPAAAAAAPGGGPTAVEDEEMADADDEPEAPPAGGQPQPGRQQQPGRGQGQGRGRGGAAGRASGRKRAAAGS
ncbi:hypothetical protein GPECTOR_34g750 [Gonium pectorale]|uniref:Uncharacterized protein n=1 Tax=Gonium pectorale TaxID=33097 RepID=A0A150GCK8_GONPE|nr:hypothetical protein GPECTOR_34g750 [Gonium pectorale]|eukprot:KXZ47591.1 hypothetical protein GPECTOR_34g750 [Gonium pectorale]